MLSILIGLPGSGKSTWAAKRMRSESQNLIWLSSDKLREEKLGTVTDQSNNELIFKYMFDLTVEALREGKKVIYDATNISSKRRRTLLERIRAEVKTETEALIFALPFEECIKRNEGRERKVPYEVIDRMYKRFEVPTLQEGFDRIGIINTSETRRKRVGEVLISLMEIPQDNPYHVHTIGKHCLEVGNFLIQTVGISDSTTDLICAGLLHDIGKKHCKVFTNKKGEKTEEAHYYGHEHVGAYDILTMDIGEADNLHVATLVQNHMRMHFLETEKAIAKIKRQLSEETYEELILLNRADESCAKNV